MDETFEADRQQNPFTLVWSISRTTTNHPLTAGVKEIIMIGWTIAAPSFQNPTHSPTAYESRSPNLVSKLQHGRVMRCLVRSMVGGGLNARVVIEITVAMNNEKEREGGREERACASLYDHITHFSGGAKRTNDERPSYEATCVMRWRRRRRRRTRERRQWWR